MPALTRFPITEAPAQQFSTVVDNRRVIVTLRYNVLIERFAMDLAIGDTTVLTGRRVVEGVDLIQPFRLGIGAIFAANPAIAGIEPTLENFANGTISLWHYA